MTNPFELADGSPTGLADLAAMVKKWNHERDRAVYRYPDGREEVLYDGGCKQCRRCQVEKWIQRYRET